MNMAALGAAIAMLATAGAAFGIALACGKGVEAIARQPDKEKGIRSLAFLGMVLIEATAIYALLVAILLWTKIPTP